MYSLIEIEEKLKNNKYPYIGALIKNNEYVYPLIIIHGNENNFINLVHKHSLEILDFTFGFDCGNIINELFILNMNFPNEHINLTDNQLSEILFSLTDDELSTLNLIPKQPNNLQSQNKPIDFNYQNIPWDNLQQIINNISDIKLQQLGYERRI